MWVDIFMFLFGFGLAFVVAYAWAARDDVPPTWEDRLATTPPAARDRSLTAAVATALRLDPETSGYAVAVSTAAGVVRLTGTVPTGHLRNRAGQLAGETPGVAGVENRVRIDPAAKPRPVNPEDHRAAVP